MKFNYHNYGDILYKTETFRFRLQGSATADITLLTMLDDNQFTYHIEITDERVPSEFRNINSADYQLFDLLKMDMISIFNDKQEALQHSIDVINMIMEKQGLIKELPFKL